MSETKRRTKSDEPRNDETGGSQAPRRQTRVTLTKDVSSKYRKIMPKANEKTGSKPKAPRRGLAEDGIAPPARTGRSRSEDSDAKRLSRERRPASSGFGRKPDAEGSRPAARSPRSAGPGHSGPARERRPSPAGPRRVTPGGPRAESRSPGRRPGPAFAAPKRPGSDVALKAIVDRELPEAAKQVKETQELILNSANEMLALTEVLEGIHQRLAEAVNSALDEHGHMKALLTPLRDETAKARGVVVGLYEKMSFQDLAGQRLMKVEDFLTALGRVLGGRDRKPGPKAGSGAPKDAAKPGKKALEPELKGPQADGGGLVQDDIDQLLAGL